MYKIIKYLVEGVRSDEKGRPRSLLKVRFNYEPWYRRFAQPGRRMDWGSDQELSHYLNTKEGLMQTTSHMGTFTDGKRTLSLSYIAGLGLTAKVKCKGNLKPEELLDYKSLDKFIMGERSILLSKNFRAKHF
ncbi:MAG: hypothetical protein ABIB79_04055 [archaeon]